MDWTEEAKTKFKDLLGEIPVFMRPLAETMGRNEVSKVAAARGVSQVDLPTLVIGLIKATPPNLKQQMNEAMVKHGINRDDYREYL